MNCSKTSRSPDFSLYVNRARRINVDSGNSGRYRRDRPDARRCRDVVSDFIDLKQNCGRSRKWRSRPISDLAQCPMRCHQWVSVPAITVTPPPPGPVRHAGSLHRGRSAARSHAGNAGSSPGSATRGIPQRADRMAFHLTGDVEQQVDLALLGAALGHARKHAPHPSRALAAGRALAAAFMLVEIRNARDRPHQSVHLSITITAAVPRPDFRFFSVSKSM